MRKKDIDLAVFYNLEMAPDNNFYYFTGYKGIGCLAVPKNAQPFMLIPKMEIERARYSSRLRSYEWAKGKRLFEQLRAILHKKGLRISTIGLDKDRFSVSVYESLKKYIKARIDDIGLDVLELRKIKSEDELAKIRRSASITSRIMDECLDNLHKIKTEKDVEIFLHKKAVEYGCSLAFPPVVASGRSASMPHYEPEDTRLKKGFCVIDFGVVYKGYHSDITRTPYIGSPSRKEREIYDHLLHAQDTLIKELSEKNSCSGLYERARELLGTYKDNFTHGLGHGLGLQIHELPNLKPLSEDTLQKGMAFTIEPGIYIPGKLGIRIEDDVMIQDKVRIITNVDKDLIMVKR